MERTAPIVQIQDDFQFLPKPSIKAQSLTYVKSTKSIYANLFKVHFDANMIVYQYPISFDPEISKENPRMKRALFKHIEPKVRAIYGECFVSGETLFAMKKIDDLTQIPFHNSRNNIDYNFIIRPMTTSFNLRNENPLQNPAVKQIYELIFKEILHANPNLEFYKNLFVKHKEKKEISSQRNTVEFYPGYTSSLIYTTKGAFINVGMKNKILSTKSALEIIESMKRSAKYTNQEQNEIRNYFTGRSIKTTYNKKNYIVDDVTFDKTPKNTTFNRDNNNINLVNYYKVAHGIDIKNTSQPLLVMYKPGINNPEETQTLYFVPELCKLAGIDDSMTKDGTFMKNLATYTKLLPKERVQRTNEFLSLLEEKNSKTSYEKEKLPSSFDKKKGYGIQVTPADKNSFNAQIMIQPKLIAGGNKSFNPEDRKPSKVIKSKDLTKWLCVYYKDNYNDVEGLFDNLSKASSAYGIKVAEPEWCEMSSKDPKEWIAAVESYKKEYTTVVFVLSKFLDRLYKTLKCYALCEAGLVSQVVKCESLSRNAMSIASKILLQVNAKLGGVFYELQLTKDMKDKNLMIVGVDSSHIRGRLTGVALAASTNSSYTQYYNKIDIIPEKKKERLDFCVAAFLREALNAYFKINQKLPGGIIIYRQGISKAQKEYLKPEVTAVDNFLNGTDEDKFLADNPIPYYYVHVNTKTTFKFFESTTSKNKTDYLNPERGLLVVEDITNPSHFEFYIQPQDVTQGTATPTCYHAAFGSMNSPALLPKLTFDLCFLYANWNGPVRVPGPLKAAEKLSKMTAKYTEKEMHQLLRNSQAYL